MFSCARVITMQDLDFHFYQKRTSAVLFFFWTYQKEKKDLPTNRDAGRPKLRELHAFTELFFISIMHVVCVWVWALESPGIHGEHVRAFPLQRHTSTASHQPQRWESPIMFSMPAWFLWHSKSAIAAQRGPDQVFLKCHGHESIAQVCWSVGWLFN
jgi:hypothetical protein